MEPKIESANTSPKSTQRLPGPVQPKPGKSRKVSAKGARKSATVGSESKFEATEGVRGRYQKSMKVQPNNPIQRLERALHPGVVKARQKDFREAERHHEGAIPLKPTENSPSYYMTFDQIEARVKNIAAQYPNFVSLEVAGESGQGRPLYLLKVNKDQAIHDEKGSVKPRFAITAGVHAREIANPSIVLNWVEGLLAAYGTDAEATALLDSRALDIFPMVNADGRNVIDEGYQNGMQSFQRKTVTDDNGESVDANRNGPFGWGGSGSSGYPSSETYRGQSAMSTPEMRTVYEYAEGVQKSEHPLTLALDVHSYSELILFPWGHTWEEHPQHAEYEALARKLSTYSGYTPQRGVELYPTDGTTESMLGTYGVPHLTFETGRAFHQSDEEFARVTDEVAPMLDYLLKVADAPLAYARGPVLKDVRVDADGKIRAQASASPVKLYEEKIAQDPRVAQSNTVHIAAVEVSTDPGAKRGAVAIEAEDGAFDEAEEAVVGEIASVQKAEKGIAYMRAQDSDGDWGPWTAFWIDGAK